MRIGVDARSLSSSITGIGRYTLELLSRITQDEENEWFIYSSRPLLSEIPSKKNVVVRTGNISNRWIRMFWYQAILPIWAAQDKCDLFWSPAHILPIFLPKRIHTVVTIHDLVWKHAPETMRPLSRAVEAKLMPRAVKCADVIMADSYSTAKDLAKEIPESFKKIKVIYLASTLSMSRKYESIETGQYILFVGTIEPRKNLPRLLEAYANLPLALRNKFPLKIVGGAGWGEQLKVPSGVEVLGYVTDAHLDRLYYNASLLLMPSIYEGFGLPIIEAMSRGTPVLTSNVSSMPEIAGSAAIYVDPSSVESILSGLYKVLSSPDLRDTMSTKGMLRAKEFSWDRSAHDVLDVFKSARLL